MINPTIDLVLPYLFPMQEEIKRHPAKRKVLAAGRRFGKTLLAADMATEGALDGLRVLISSTTQEQSDVFWQYITGQRAPYTWFAPLIKAKLATKNENTRVLTTATGGRIRIKTGSQPDVLRGDDADLIIFDECAYLHPNAWFAVAAPMLADRDGTAVFISSPKRKNWFYHLFLRGQNVEDDRWQSWNLPSTANPYLNRTALNELVGEMPTELYRQEILAEFIDSEGQVFRNLSACQAPLPAVPYRSTFVAGVDWGQSEDYTVVIIMDKETGAVVDFDRFRRISWQAQRDRIARLYHKWHVEDMLVEANSIGGPNLEALQNTGLKARGFTTTSESKERLINALALAFETGSIKIPPDQTFLNELEAFESKQSPHTYRVTYSAPSGFHDDIVIALALAHHAATSTYKMRIKKQ